MKRIKAIKNGIVSNQSEFKSVDEANAWLNDMIASNSFGKPERWLVVHKGFDDIEYVEGEDISQAIETRVGIGSLGEEIVEKKFAAEYQIVEEDITAELAARAALLHGKKCQDFGADLIAQIHAMNDAKQLSVEQMQAILNDQSLAMIERCLWNGSINTAKALIMQLQPGLFSEQEIAVVAGKIDQFLAGV